MRQFETLRVKEGFIPDEKFFSQIDADLLKQIDELLKKSEGIYKEAYLLEIKANKLMQEASKIESRLLNIVGSKFIMLRKNFLFKREKMRLH